jgi:hypothetical protein
MGVPAGLGDSEHQDKYSGGANSIFLRVGHTKPVGGGPALVWDDPSVLLRRSDYYGYNNDHYGAVNPHSHKYNAKAKTSDPYKIAGFTSGTNEVMIRNGIDLVGAEAPDRILCGSAAQRTSLLKLFKNRGITHLRGKPVTDVVQ